MAFSDERIEQLIARLDAGEAIEPETVRELLDEIKAGRRLVGLAGEMLNVVKRAMLTAGVNLAEKYEREREQDLSRNREVSEN